MNGYKWVQQGKRGKTTMGLVPHYYPVHLSKTLKGKQMMIRERFFLLNVNTPKGLETTKPTRLSARLHRVFGKAETNILL